MEKANSLLQKEISNILNRKRSLGLGLMTVTQVDCAKDLKSAKIWISVLKEPEKNLKILQNHRSAIQQELNKRLQMKFVPKIHFQLDHSQENLNKIDRLLKEEEKSLGLDTNDN